MYKSSAKFMFGECFVSKSSPIFYCLPLDSQTQVWLSFDFAEQYE